MALTFNGSSSQLVGTNIVTGYPFSMFCWIRPNSLTTGQMVMGVGDEGGATEAAMFADGSVSGDPLKAHSRTTGGSSGQASSPTGMSLATWQPCLVVFLSASSRTVYFDSGAPASHSGSNTLGFANFDRFVIGVRPISATLRANMDIAHAAVWADELGPDEWLHLKNGAYPDDIKPWSLTDYWELATNAATQTGVNGTVLTATDTATAGTSPTMEQAVPGGEPLRTDGIWTWYTEPRAVYYNGASYIGWVSSGGDIGITKYTHATKFRESYILHAALEADDHDNASVYIRPDGRIICFYGQHLDASGVRYRISDNAEDIGSWSSEAFIDLDTSYSNPRYLSDLDRLHLHYRQDVNDNNLAYSDDDGATWSTPVAMFTAVGRPYVKSITNGVDRIDFFMSNGHPGEDVTSIYHCYAIVETGSLKFYNLGSGTELTLPISVSSCTQIYDSSVSSVAAWPWDATYDSNGYPRIVYSRGVSDSDQRYDFVRWTGSAWTTPVEITTGGAALYSGQPYYAYGICFSKLNPDAVFVAVEGSGVGEIQEWGTADDGATWSKTRDVTTGSSVKNARPYTVLTGSGEMLLWWGGTYTSYTSYNTNIYSEEIAGGGPTEYVITPSGGVAFSGAASLLRGRVFPASGGVSFGGTAGLVTHSVERIITPSGGVVFGGTATLTMESDTDFVIAPSGGVTFGGGARLIRGKILGPVSGGLALGGTAPLEVHNVERVYSPSGGVVFSGHAVVEFTSGAAVLVSLIPMYYRRRGRR